MNAIRKNEYQGERIYEFNGTGKEPQERADI